jgi:hypothetical protein
MIERSRNHRGEFFLFSYFCGIYALKNENSLDFLFPLEKLFSLPLLQRDFVSRCSRHASGTAQSCIKAKEKDKQP